MKIINTTQAAKILKINQSRVRQLILSGRLPAIKFGRDWAINVKFLKMVRIRKTGRPKKELKKL